MDEYTIKYNNTDIKVNPTIFAEKSQIFKSYYVPSQSMTITGERSLEEFQQLLPYVQGEDPVITIDNIEDLKSFAEEWEVQSLKDDIEKWKIDHEIDVKLEEFLENARARIPVSSYIPYMADNINELVNKPKFLNVPPKLLHQILTSASKQEKIKNHHALYNFIMNFINQDQQNRLNLLNFINPKLLTQSEVEQFFESNLLPEDSFLLSQIPTFLTNLAILFREKYQNEQILISKIELDIQKQDSIYEKKNKEYQIAKDQLADLQQQNRQLSKKFKPKKNKSAMVYNPDSDPDRRTSNPPSQKRENIFSYTPSYSNSNSNSNVNTNSNSSSRPSSSFNHHERGGRGRGRGRGGGPSRSTPNQPSPNSNPNLGVATFSSEAPPFSMPMPMSMPMDPNVQMPINPNIQNMNAHVMTPAQIQDLNILQQQYQLKIQQISQNTPLMPQQVQELQYYTNLYLSIQKQIDQQKQLQLYMQQQKQKQDSNHSVSIQKNAKFQSPTQTSPLGMPITSIQTSNSSTPAVTPIQVDKLVPSISVEKPKIKQKALDPEQMAMIAASKKSSVKIEKPQRGASIEFGKANDDQT